MLYRLGNGAAAHPWRTIGAWLLLIGIAVAAASAFGGTPQDNWDVPGARAQKGIDELRAHVPGRGGSSAQVVVHDRDGHRLAAGDLDALTRRLDALPHTAYVSEPRLSADGDTALVTVAYDVPTTDPDIMGTVGVDQLESALAPERAAGLQAELGGELPSTGGQEMKGTGEMAGIVVALVLLVLAFGSVVAAGLPLAIALTGLGVGSAGVTVLAGTMDVSTSAPTVATMVGLGVGIDYALLLVTRHVEFLSEGHEKRVAAGRAVATAGRSVVFASATVLVSLMGLRLAGLPVYSSFGFATAITVLAVMATAITLVPALCGLAGNRLLPRRVRRARKAGHGLQTATKRPLTARWAARVARRPLPAALAALVVLLSLAAPTLAMRTWPQDGSTNSTDTTIRRAYDLITEEYGAGANGPLTVVVDRSVVSDGETRAIAARLADRPGIVGVTTPQTTPDGALSVLEAEPAYGPTDERTTTLIETLRDDVLPDGVEVTGTTPLFADISVMLTGRMWLVVGFVVGLSVLLLTMMFRSVIVPLKAAVMNLLSIGAAYGVLTAAFQWGWAGGLLGIDHPVPVSSWIPILMFAILFGLSMDYEVFLLSRVREEWLATGDARRSVERGLSATGRVISSAAAIMVAVFLGFATEADVVVKMLGFGMAVAILLDATVVRLVLVPATMAMLGRWNWWLPGWLDRLLPRIEAETSADLWDELDALPGPPAPERTTEPV
ncbi:MMPL family transporter [Nocardioides ungokensis]|uniref:MMPL family transporter n=1 Tax=Nocardioides ungokensis TaxID=1643322 RepID=UPI001FEB1F88|nr:MMPL family transporter [Nocardioides ungokensis]